MQKIPISGGPCTGKTTLIDALREEFPDAHFVPEPAERVIQREVDAHIVDPRHAPVFPMTDYRGFLPLVIAESVELEAAIPHNAELVFQDRSLIDNLGYAALQTARINTSGLVDKIAAANYAFAFFCERLGLYEATAVRHETDDQAGAIHDALRIAYDEAGIAVIHLPPVSVEERVDMVRQVVIGENAWR